MSNLKKKLVHLMQSGEIELISTHSALSFPIIERIYRKMLINVPFTGIQIAGNAIINGHHRYLASLLANYGLDRFPGIRSQAKLNVDWSIVVLDDRDWDPCNDIERFNKADDACIGLSLKEFLEKTK